ncbi:hypothetical protein UK99_11340 [Frankia casuarinae]|uniref:Uncharacterized protein n=1 Tax=Frankia casuarinae (strain DSM 45818 / CECT 9043 / HFP020203 / CcI3) TaxID=106370 RepID=Q2JCE3_FRACC|nr:hypothetical protein Francci3_1673 [Frankia casuarinae]OHV57860.1 hypothetical protein CgIS1_01720 [Frankia sp. CgIS1]ORT95874.1 hypothetical protein UK99_11340 [Frankia casuarinae]
MPAVTSDGTGRTHPLAQQARMADSATETSVPNPRYAARQQHRRVATNIVIFAIKIFSRCNAAGTTISRSLYRASRRTANAADRFD